MTGKPTRTKEEKASIVMEALTGSTSIAEICRRYNVTSSAFYKWRDAFIAGGTASLEPGKSSKEVQLRNEVEGLKTIIGELTVANETLKKFNSPGEEGCDDFPRSIWIQQEQGMRTLRVQQIPPVL